METGTGSDEFSSSEEAQSLQQEASCSTHSYIKCRRKKDGSRKQFFSQKWLQDPLLKGWLEPMDDSSKSKCLACNLILNTKYSDLVKHTKSKRHVKNIHNQKSHPKINVMLSKPTKEAEIVAAAVLRTSLMLAAHNLSFNCIDHVSEVSKINFNDSNIAGQMNLKHTKCTMIIKHVLASTIKEELKSLLKNKKVSLLLDESTDLSNKKLLCILVKYVNDNVLVTNLLDIKEVEADGATAKGLYTSLKQSLTDFEISSDNIIGYCADNANVMMGIRESVKTYLLSDNPKIIVNGCICHSVHLVAMAAADKIPPNVESLLQNLSNYFSRSPKRQCILEEFQEFMKTEKLKLLKPSHTRWLALSNCVERTLKMWDVLTELFRVADFEDGNSVASIIYNELCNPVTKAYLSFFKYILPVFNKFNAFFQSQKNLTHMLYHECLRFLKFLGSNFIKGEYLIENEMVSLNVLNPHVLLELDKVNIGLETQELLKNFDNTLKTTFLLKCIEFYQTAFLECTKRFPLNKFYKNLNFVDPHLALNKNFSCDLKFVIDKLCVNTEEADNCHREYMLLKTYFSEKEIKALPTSLIEFWQHLKSIKDFTDRNIFFNIGNLALQVLTLPQGNADVERVFSILSDIKRNRLSTDVVTSLLRIKIDLFNKKICCKDFVFHREHFKRYYANRYD